MLTDGRRVIGILVAHLGAFGLGELKTRSEVNVKVAVIQKWYVTLPSQDASTHQIWDSYLKDIGDMICT